MHSGRRVHEIRMILGNVAALSEPAMTRDRSPPSCWFARLSDRPSRAICWILFQFYGDTSFGGGRDLRGLRPSLEQQESDC